MAKIIDITDKLSPEKPAIKIGDKVYEVNDTMQTVLQFQKLAMSKDSNMEKMVELALGVQATKEIDIMKMSIQGFKSLTIGLLAAMQGMEFEEAERRFQKQV